MKVYVVSGSNSLLNSAGPVGVSATREGAEEIAKANKWILDKHIITEHEVD